MTGFYLYFTLYYGFVFTDQDLLSTIHKDKIKFKS